ncbi:MAG: hypothetical protein HZB65_01810 [Candidatus Aenigmarchaeota archaeon]|nr:hypothetical protein [Candidatus Aenigmarchaeota archaeon]
MIKEQGGKFGALTYLKEALPHLPIKPYEVRDYRNLKKVCGLKMPLIVRSSHPAEFWGMAGLLDSVKDVDYDRIGEAVRQIERSFRNQELKLYAQQRSIELGNSFYVGIQEQSNSVYNGSMMRHPNNPDVVFVGICNGDDFRKRNIAFCVNSGEIEESVGDTSIFNERELHELFDIYKQIEKSDLMPGFSLQVEFGLEPLSIYQARPFKKKETTDFDIPESEYITDMAFGITSPEGILLPLVKGVLTSSLLSYGNSLREDISDLQLRNAQLIDSQNNNRVNTAEYLKKYLQDKNYAHKNGFAFMLDDVVRGEPYLIDIAIPNMKAFLCFTGSTFLTHEMFRMMQNSDVSMLEINIRNIDISNKIRLICNGKRAVVIPE